LDAALRRGDSGQSAIELEWGFPCFDMELFTISVWLRRVSITVSRVMPAGRGVRVVNTVLFDILNVEKGIGYRMRFCLSKCEVEKTGREYVLVEDRCGHEVKEVLKKGTATLLKISRHLQN
jgi:hypothetical protein